MGVSTSVCTHVCMHVHGVHRCTLTHALDSTALPNSGFSRYELGDCK